MLLCLDIGNTHTHHGIVRCGEVFGAGDFPTRSLADPASGIHARMAALLAAHPAVEGAAFCSVVPGADDAVRRLAASLLPGRPVYQLTCESPLGIPVSYPRPSEIGQDRLANAAAAAANHGTPAVIIDMGTAVTFDIVTRGGGYEGGIIAPGVEIMRRYLHEQTALLPLLDDSTSIAGPIGHSTREAMRIGCVLGFAGMIQALLDAVLLELEKRGEPAPLLLSTGGSAQILEGRLKPAVRHEPHLTLFGIARAWELHRGGGTTPGGER